MSGTIVRVAGVADVEVAAALFDEYRQLYGCVTDVSAAAVFLRERFMRGDAVLLLALEAGTGTAGNEEPVSAGFACLHERPSSVSLQRSLVLNDVYVRPGVRRRGVGKALMAAVAEFAESAGVVDVTLTTELSNRRAQALYDSAGWLLNDHFRLYTLPTKR